MERKLFEDRKRQFKKTVELIGNLPRVWQIRFDDGEDQRIWFDKLLNIDNFSDYIKELLNKYDKKILTDKEKEECFYKYILLTDKIPVEREAYFSDNSDMYRWYMSYKDRHQDFETKVHDSLSENNNLDLAELWSDIEKEFKFIIKKIKRIPKHNEVILQNGIDVRSVYDKLETFDPKYYEKINLFLATFKNNGLTTSDRINELLAKVSELGYMPILQESRFSDKCDMFTWYSKYKDIVPELETEVNKRVKNKPVTKVNIYLIPNFKNTEGKFYDICTNVGEVLDLSDIDTYEEAKKKDSTLTKRGSLLLKKDEEIGTISKGGRK